MSSTQLIHKSYFIKDHIKKCGKPHTYPVLESNLTEQYDVAIIGAGWFGLNLALKLSKEGKKLIILEADKVGYGATAFSTGKISSQHQMKYTDLISNYGKKTAEEYGLMNEKAISDLDNIIQEYNIKCEWTRCSHTVLSDESPKEVSAIKQETLDSNISGLKSSFQVELEDLPTTIRHGGALKVEDQGHLNPFSYLMGLSDTLRQSNVPIYEYTRVKDVSFGAVNVIKTVNGNTIRADKIVSATHLPIFDRTGHFSTCKPSRSYCIAVTLTDNSKMIKDTYINMKQPDTISFRPSGDGKALIVCGASHPAGTFPTDPPEKWGYGALESWAREHFPVKDVIGKWSTMDYYSPDSLPYIGVGHRGTNNLYLATGFGKWGFTQGLAASKIVCDLIMGRENSNAYTFDARRWNLTHSIVNTMKTQVNVSKHFIGDRIDHALNAIDIQELAPGEGNICKDNNGTVAAYRDDDGIIHKFDARCTHMGCHLQWNPSDKIFECPCHGSCFGVDGGVLHGPSVKPMKKLEDETPFIR